MRLKLTLCFLLVMVSSISLRASSHQVEAKVTGVVLDPTDAVVPDSKISFLSGVVQRYAYSNELGAFEIWLPAGDYEVEIEDNRFKKYSLKRLELTTRVAKELRINLEFLPYPICILTVSTGGERIEQKPAPLSEKITARKIQ